MGMDVFGLAPTSATGEYFRRNVWGWHPLWEYVERNHPEIAVKVEAGHSNDGDGLGAEDAAALADLLREDLRSGQAHVYVVERDVALAALAPEPCHLCEGTGVRRDDVAVRAGMDTRGWCNGCDGSGQVLPWVTHYSLDASDIAEFADFLADSGGFTIC